MKSFHKYFVKVKVSELIILLWFSVQRLTPLCIVMYNMGRFMKTTSGTLAPTPEEAALILSAAEQEHVLPDGYIVRKLEDIRGNTRDMVKAVAETEKRELSPEQKDFLVSRLRGRFLADKRGLHPNVQWEVVEKSILARPDLMWSLFQMEITGGYPDVVVVKGKEEADVIVFAEQGHSLKEQRSHMAFDGESEALLPAHVGKYNGNAVDMAKKWGADLMEPKIYEYLRGLGAITGENFWLKTPAGVRQEGYAFIGKGEVGVADMKLAIGGCLESLHLGGGGTPRVAFGVDFLCMVRFPKVN